MFRFLNAIVSLIVEILFGDTIRMRSNPTSQAWERKEAGCMIWIILIFVIIALMGGCLELLSAGTTAAP